jgi:hypothetical protein
MHLNALNKAKSEERRAWGMGHGAWSIINKLIKLT